MDLDFDLFCPFRACVRINTILSLGIASLTQGYNTSRFRRVTEYHLSFISYLFYVH